MHHVKPTAKGDPLCPLGFHPQVRWPTRCKRCFRDYKEHGNRGKDSNESVQLRKDELTVSTPALSPSSQRNRLEQTIPGDSLGTRSWTSSSNLSTSGVSSYKNDDSITSSSRLIGSSSSWTSSPNLAGDSGSSKDEVSVSITLPRRRSSAAGGTREDSQTSGAPARGSPAVGTSTRRAEVASGEDDARRTQYTVRRRTSPGLSHLSSGSTTSNSYSSEPPVEAAKLPLKQQADFSQGTNLATVRPPVKKFSPLREIKKIQTQGKTLIVSREETSSDEDTSSESSYSLPHKATTAPTSSLKSNNETRNEFIAKEKEYKADIEQLQKELDAMKIRCEKAEREKSDFLMRRLDSSSTRASSSEILKLQQKVNELRSTVEDLQVDKNTLSQKLRDLQYETDSGGGGRGGSGGGAVGALKRENETLKERLRVALRRSEELTSANEEMKRELKELEEEMDEMHDKFREDRADEYSMLKKELDQATKNCRILSFKLRKAERKCEQLEVDKFQAEQRCREVAGGQLGLDKAERIKKLEHDLAVANETSERLQKELEEQKQKNSEEKASSGNSKKKPPKLGSLPKTPSGEKVSRESLTRGDSQEDPVQLLRDLQDSLEREADLREQLRFAEEEAENLRKKAARVEDDNESLVLQLKKMASKARSRRHSPSQQRLTPEPLEKDEGISDEDDPSELRLLLELNEQEAAVLRRKVEDLESEGNLHKRKIKELQDKLAAKSVQSGREMRSQIQQAEPKKINAVYEQKIKVLEEEMRELRKKVIEKERECERLHAEVSIGGGKRAGKSLQKSKSLDLDQQTVDLKRQLQLMETEASVLRSKSQSLEAENERLQKENSKFSLLLASRRAGSLERGGTLPPVSEAKNTASALEKQLAESNKKIKELEEKLEKKPAGSSKSESIPSVAEVEKLRNQLKKMEAEKKKHEECLTRLREMALEEAVEFYKARTPKKPTDLTTKLQLKKMVDELENEIGDILVVLKKAEESRKKLSEAECRTVSDGNSNKEELKEMKEKFERLIKEAKDECQKKDVELEKLNKMIENLESDKIKVLRERDSAKSKYEKEIEKLTEAKSELEKQKKKTLEEIDKLKSELGSKSVLTEEIEDLKKQVTSLKRELANERKTSSDLKTKCESFDKTVSDYKNLQLENANSKKKIEELESKLSEVEDKLKKSEKLANAKKEKVLKLDKEYTELNKKYTALEKDLEAMTISKHDIASKYEEAEERISKLKVELDNKNLEIKKLENAAKSKANPSKTSSTSESKLQEELSQTKKKLKEISEQLDEAQELLKAKEKEFLMKEKDLTKQVEEWELKASDLEMDLQANRKTMERLKTTQEREMKAKEIEILQLKQQDSGLEKLNETKKILQEKIDSLELALESEKHEYDDLTKRYEELEEEHVVMKSTLVKEKEKVQSQLAKAANELEDVENELRSLKENYNMKQDYWVKEKHKLEEKMKDYETLSLQKTRLQALCEERQSEIDQLKNEAKCFAEQLNYLRKDSDDLRRKLEDYENLDRVHRNVSDTASLETELKEYKSRLAAEEKARKKEMSSLRMKYENRLSLISQEILALQTQMGRLKKERDSYKQLLEAARRNIADLKTSGLSLSKGSPNESELRKQISGLENQLGLLEDELSESRSEASRLRTELNTERANWEISLSELTSRLNEMEEDRILSSGRTRVSGTKTRMELAWQKEREEQHRLLQETSTLARDLRQTLFEVERERDRERLEAKRKLDQLKKSNEEEQEEIRKKLNEMQCDLLELRDAHAKLRTTNEKLRREKDRLERDRDLLRQSISIKKKIEQEEERQIIGVAQLVEELTVLAPELFPSKPPPPLAMPTPPVRRKGPKSREASPALERKDYSRESSVGRDDAKSQEVQEILRRLTEAATQLKRVQQEDRATFRKAFGSFRSSSVESDATDPEGEKVRRRTGLQRKPSLLRKSLSLDQTTADEQQVWTENEKEGSVTSFQSLEESEALRQAHLLRDVSLDSRLSGGSTQSEIIPSEKKKKLGLFGKLKKLTKSRSIDQESDIGSSSQLDPGSDTSLNIAEDRSGKPLKNKFSGMFKKSGSTSRGNSMERSVKATTPVSDSTQRPLVSTVTSSAGESSKPLVKKPPATAPVQRKIFKK